MAKDLVHSEESVVMFLGYLTATLPELHAIEAPRMLDAWQSFKREMGKDATPLKSTHIHQWLPVGDRCGPMVEYVCPCGAGMYDPQWPHRGS